MTLTTMSIADVLTATLNPDSSTRISAELKLAELFAVPGELHCVGISSCRLIISRVVFRNGFGVIAACFGPGRGVISQADESSL
jgi:hypothetical protein